MCVTYERKEDDSDHIFQLLCQCDCETAFPRDRKSGKERPCG